MLNIVLFGPPGSGKGTQSKLVAARYNLMHLSTGDIFRREIGSNTAMGELLSKFMDRGLLVPDSIVLRELFKAALSYRNYPGLIFDGFPRTVYQADLLNRVLGKKGIDIHLVISMEVPEEALLERILKRATDQGRSDDTSEAFHQRYLQYQYLTMPVITFYKRRHIYHPVDGTRAVDDVFNSICEIIHHYLDKRNQEKQA